MSRLAQGDELRAAGASAARFLFEAHVAHVRGRLLRRDPVLLFTLMPALHADALAHYDVVRLQQIEIDRAIQLVASPR